MSQLIRVVNIFHFVLRPPPDNTLKRHLEMSQLIREVNIFHFVCTLRVIKFPTSKATAYWIVSSHWMTHISACPEKAHWRKRKSPWDGEESRQGWRHGDSARLPPMWPGFDSCPEPYVVLVCCWFSPLSGAFSPGSLVFLPQNLHLQIQIRPGSRASSLNIVVYLFIIYYLFIDTDTKFFRETEISHFTVLYAIWPNYNWEIYIAY